MPQFDIFSFFSQIFWVFFGFLFLYLALSFYLLPALSTTLKIRKRKLSQTTNVSDSVDIATYSSLLADYIKNFVTTINNKLFLIETDSKQFSLYNSKLSLISAKTEAFRQFNFSVLTQTQLSAVLFV
jgi:hypothetical protein